MQSDYKSASEVAQGDTWIKALSLFMRRRNALSEFIGPECEQLFQTEGTFQEISQESSLSRRLLTGRAQTYELPTGTQGQLHKNGCNKAKILEKVSWFHLSRFSREPSPATLEFVEELQNTEELSELIQRFGGFWMWVLREISQNELKSRGYKNPLTSGTYEFFYLNESIYERMAAADVSIPEVTALFVDAMEECPCIGFKKCVFCAQIFIPTAWSFVNLKLGQRVCTLCAELASDGRQAFPWLEMSNEEIKEEIAFGLSLQRELHRNGTFNFKEAPQYDSEIAFRTLRLYSLPDEDFVKGFLTVALRPKEAQVRLVFGFWEQWLMEIHGAKRNSTTGLDGHSCNSLGEKTICDYLFEHRIEHRREPKYSEHVDDQREALVRHFKGDFEVGGIIYEYAGMDGNVEYDKKMLVKLNYAERLGIKVVVITPGDLHKLDELFL